MNDYRDMKMFTRPGRGLALWGLGDPATPIGLVTPWRDDADEATALVAILSDADAARVDPEAPTDEEGHVEGLRGMGERERHRAEVVLQDARGSEFESQVAVAGRGAARSAELVRQEHRVGHVRTRRRQAREQTLVVDVSHESDEVAERALRAGDLESQHEFARVDTIVDLEQYLERLADEGRRSRFDARRRRGPREPKGKDGSGEGESSDAQGGVATHEGDPEWAGARD